MSAEPTVWYVVTKRTSPWCPKGQKFVDKITVQLRAGGRIFHELHGERNVSTMQAFADSLNKRGVKIPAKVRVRCDGGVIPYRATDVFISPKK